jgi:hypothetical protein
LAEYPSRAKRRIKTIISGIRNFDMKDPTGVQSFNIL